ncbi:hypothetical protein VB712_03420 [Spirulina sp. CCNP1310]|uniref:hypothetical protein n=1 Tax=Spirulina sp. CCNP1310 TaxID=3110249 RepID=UPI002B202991|nr:hypothetical protein [Spirulina sp. CCNP1310]MEA5418260.1 hypothetical protein [Spirulina sp. CCNP1310]
MGVESWGRLIFGAFAWIFFGLILWRLGSFVRDLWIRAATMHRIPCTQCQFFTNQTVLKCTVHPDWANTETAIFCRDFHPQD